MSGDSIFEIALKGMAIGFLAAAPTGPSGVLVIQRTLNKGRWKGFLTGLGVSVSDAVYIFITMMCLSLVLGYLEDPMVSSVVKLAGCALLLVFGITTVRNNPLAASREVTVKKDSFGQIMLTGFLVAIVNPLVIFFYMGLFAFFSLPVDDFSAGLKMQAYLFTLLGDICWWFTISTVINKLRNRFDLRGLWVINRVLGTILIVSATVWLAVILVKI
ncbi:MAG: LysE family translocator [Bacteroidaceae bacterium]|nr:LysE family translocator [Bacteroidaceae bacterium]MBP5646869.1 LysE family translocator [Bacteroidaceae bacterium]